MNAVSSYHDFLAAKMVAAPATGFDVLPEEVNPALKEHIRAIVPWALRGGQRAVFARFGMAKTTAQIEIGRLVLRKAGGPFLVVLPLGVRAEFFDDAEKFFTGEFAVRLKFIRTDAEIEMPADDGPVAQGAVGDVIHLTNYESVREGKVTPARFQGASLDEAAVLRGFGTKTFQTFLPLFEAVRFKFVATATPSPNRTKELIHYAGFLGVMDTGQALTRFFQRNPEKAGDLQLFPHKEDEFWLWVHSWAVFLQKPSDLGFSDEGYDLPGVDVHWHEVAIDHSTAGVDSYGQGMLLRDAAMGVVQSAAAKRDSLDGRIAKMLEIIALDPAAHRLLWHDLEAERHAIEAAVPGVASIFGSQKLEVNEAHALAFKRGELQYLGVKKEMSGAGCNFQPHCHHAIHVGIDDKFHDFIQAFYRIVRFGQKFRCRVDIIYSEAQREQRRNLEGKWREYDAQMERMSAIVRRYGLNHLPAETVLRRSIGVVRRVERGDGFEIAHNDAVDEAAKTESNSVGQIVTSIPFANHYEYCESFNDFGHTDDNAHFWAQMDFLTPEMERILKPGRLACIHVKDRILFGAVTGEGVPTVSPFHAEAIFHYLRHGFQYCGMVTITTDVVAENNQTYRLTYSEMMKDATKMGVGCPEYLLIFRKPQTDKSRGYADEPVMHAPPLVYDGEGGTEPWTDGDRRPQVPGSGYTLGRWQIDAHDFWPSSGSRLLTTDELVGMGEKTLKALWKQLGRTAVYDYEEHVRLGEELAARKALPKTFMLLDPQSNHDAVWTDIMRARTLNARQVARGREKHVCPLQIDIVNRCIGRWSNPGDLIYDPFGGIGTVPYLAMLAGRRGKSSELNETYFRDALAYCREAEARRAVPSLFDMLGAAAAEEAA